MGLLSWLRGGRGTERPAQAPPREHTPPPREDRFDIPELPPLQRILGSPVLVADPSAFERGLPTRRPTALSRPLGHLVSAEAPSGLVAGVTTPVQRSATDFPVRAPEAVLAQPGASAEVVTVPPAGGGTAWTPGPGPSPRPEAGPGPEPGPDAEPVTPVAEGSAPFGPVQRTSSDLVPPARMPEPPHAHEPPTEAVGSPTESSVRPLVGEQPLLDVPAGADPADETPPPVQRSLPPTGTPSTPSPAPAATPRRTPGLGAPLPALPPTAQRQAPGSLPAPGPAPATAASPLPVRGEAAPPPAPPPAPAPEPVSAPEPVAPLLADRPLLLRTVTAETAETAKSARTAPTAAPPAPAVPVRWGTAPVQRHMASAPVQRTAHPAPPSLQRTVDRPPTPDRPPRPAPPRDAGDVAVAAGIAQRMADGSVLFAPPPPVQRSASAAPPPSLPFVQREATTEEPPPPPPPAETAPDPAPDPVPDPPAGLPEGANPPATAPESTAPPGTPSGTPPVTDEFVRALYPPLARLLKAELRLERERAGRLIDTRF
ncbi:hypothetical protein [Streptomyces sp. NPDC126499]|uniref:hypothetical protein n=1 Tax=Streptomyces sp. NPDC126499 TaxID=3155314 RepID=UPI00331C9413